MARAFILHFSPLSFSLLLAMRYTKLLFLPSWTKTLRANESFSRELCLVLHPSEQKAS